jgi:hypothetical protein
MINLTLEEKRAILSCIETATIAENFNGYKLLGGHQNEYGFQQMLGQLSNQLETEIRIVMEHEKKG